MRAEWYLPEPGLCRRSTHSAVVRAIQAHYIADPAARGHHPLGSGLGALADQATDATVIPYTDLPHFHGTSVEKDTRVAWCSAISKGVPTVFLQGRFHVYEGYPMEEVVFPTRT